MLGIFLITAVSAHRIADTLVLIHFQRNMSVLKNEHKEDLKKVTDLYNLKPESRWRVYLDAVDSIKNELMIKMNTLLVRYLQFNS